MSKIATLSNSHSRITVTVFAVLFIVLLAACDDFYSDSPPTPDIAQPTPANVREGNPEQNVEIAARDAMAVKLGISADAPRKILLEHATWTNQNPGCYPTPELVLGSGPYLIPGYRILMLHDDVFYEYNTDQGVGTGALCDSTLQLIPAEPVYDIVTTADDAEPDFDTIHVLHSEEDIAEFNSNFSEMATISLNQIEWPEEVLIGGWVNSSPNPEATRAYLSPQGTSILIEVAVPEEFAQDAGNNPSQIWAFVDITEPDSTYEFVLAEYQSKSSREYPSTRQNNTQQLTTSKAPK
ncbi:MAG TPA: hypothetical protein EYQ61_04525 [Dehalococcoidia bacterium]|jgi:hypothetical protein|nr:hypothetical protein [Dehalococcoidia bacterium]HIK88997.1 hypothetical protein [Dehalococcoidia bacterium]